MDTDGDGALDEAYERLHRTGPEYEGWLTNHGPMAAESMVRGGHGRVVHRWLDGYLHRLEERPGGTSPIGPGEWRDALGDERRLGDWLAFFDREVRERPWREVLTTWWPRLLPGIAAGATHGVIRTGHATRTLLARDEAYGPRVAELGQALGYWAARWQPVPAVAIPAVGSPTAAGAEARAGTARADDALGAVPRVPDQSQGIRYRLGQLADLPGWAPVLGALRPAGSPEAVPARLAEVADAATVRYLTHGHGSGVMLVHAATAPTAVLRTLPALPATLWEASLNAAWAASAAVTAAYAPAEPAPRPDLPVAVTGPGAAEEVFARAVRHGDEHVIKLADTCLEVYGRTGDTDALSAAIRATELIAPDA
jgi:hypothetical protein